MEEIETIEATVDKGHLITIGERLYEETQEISLMKEPRNPRQAYERQSKLLKDALAKDDE